MQRGSQDFLSIALPSTTIMCHLFYICYLSYLLSYLLCMLNAYHIILIVIWIGHVCVFHKSLSSSSSRLIGFLVLWPIRFMKLLSHQQRSFLSPRSCPVVSAWFPTCLYLHRTQKMNVEWTILTAAVCKFRCGAQTTSHVDPHSVPYGVRSRSCPDGCMVFDVVAPP